jgi:hypothetical protein
MPLPGTIRVKLSSEAADYVSLTPVVVQEMPVRDLVEHMLGITGKDEARIRDLLLRGTLVSGASRFRWTGWDADAESVRTLLRAFPDPDPGRPFSAPQCTRVVLRGPRQPIPIPREAATSRGLMARLLRRKTFWDFLMKLAGTGNLQYGGYSYRDRSDIYHAQLAAPQTQQLKIASRLIRYTALETQVRAAQIESAEFYVVRT